jgi:nucleotidyltransferase AbiEii toxin of type IV toxin-antitoxin system
MLGDGALTFREFVMRERWPLATIHDAVLEFLRHRDDAVVSGAHAVNAYAAEPRMTQDVDVLSTRARELAEELREHLKDRFHIDIGIREACDGLGYRLFQVRREGNRHLVDVRSVETLPPAQRIEDTLVVKAADLIAAKVMAFVARRGKPRSGTDWRDLAHLLLAFPELKTGVGPVRDRLISAGADQAVLQAWDELVAQEILPEDEDDEF